MNQEITYNNQCHGNYLRSQFPTSLWEYVTSSLFSNHLVKDLKKADKNFIRKLFQNFPEINSFYMKDFNQGNGSISINGHKFYCADKYGYQDWDFPPRFSNYPLLNKDEDKSALIEMNLSENRLREFCDILHKINSSFYCRHETIFRTTYF